MGSKRKKPGKWRYLYFKNGKFVKAGTKGAKRKRIPATSINRKISSQRTGKILARRALEKRRKKNKGKLAVAKGKLKKIGAKSLGKYTNPFNKRVSSYYDVPFIFVGDGNYDVSFEAISQIITVEQINDPPPAQVYAMIWVRLKDGDEQWIQAPRTTTYLSDEPGLDQLLYESILQRLLEYEISEILSIHLHFFRGEKDT